MKYFFLASLFSMNAHAMPTRLVCGNDGRTEKFSKPLVLEHDGLRMGAQIEYTEGGYTVTAVGYRPLKGDITKFRNVVISVLDKKTNTYTQAGQSIVTLVEKDIDFNQVHIIRDLDETNFKKVESVLFACWLK